METVVVEISSSDDEGEITPRGELWRASSFKRPYRVAEDDDEITVLDGIPSEMTNDRLKRVRSGIYFQDVEDDCLVLDGNPEKVVADPGDVVDDLEDLVVTAETGQVACRDFPHPRHLCAKFPFKSTPHEKYCGKCHCFVCDKPAPCLFWGKDNFSKDHCHSSDKEEKWKKMRGFFKMRDCKEPTLQQSFNTILSLTTMRTRVPISRSNQTSTNPVFPLQLNLSTDAGQPTICTRSDEQRSFSSTYLRNRTSDKEASSAPINYMYGKNRRVGQTGSRFQGSDKRNPSNLGFHRHGTFARRSNGNRFSGDNLPRHRNNLNALHTNNNRSNSRDGSLTLQTHVINIPSSEHMYANGLLLKDSSCATPDENLNKLWDYLVGGDSEESNSIQNDPFTGLSLNRIHSDSSIGSSFNRIHNDFSTGSIFNRIQNDSSTRTSFNNKLEAFGNPDITIMTMNPNASTQPLPTCVTSNHALQLLPQSGASMGISNANDNVQWTHVHASPSFCSTVTEQCISSSDLQSLNCDWLGDTEAWDCVCVEDQYPTIPTRYDTETVLFTAQQQQPEWSIPLVNSALNNTIGQMSSEQEVNNIAGQMSSEQEVNNTAGQMSSEQGFVASSIPDNVSYVDLNNSWDTFAMRQNISSYFECT